MGGVGARPIWAPPRFSAKWDGRWRTGRATVIDGAYLRGHAPGRHLDSRATGVGACAVKYTRVDRARAAACDLRCYLRSNREERNKGCRFRKRTSTRPAGEFLFGRGGRTTALNVANFLLEYVGVNREIDRKMGSLKKRPIPEIDTLPPGPIASRHTGHARPTSLVFPPSVTCSTNSTTHQASFVQVGVDLREGRHFSTRRVSVRASSVRARRLDAKTLSLRALSVNPTQRVSE